MPTDFANDRRLTTNDRTSRSRHSSLRDGRTVGAPAVIITTGTFLNGLIHCGEQQYPAGRSGEPTAVLLGEALKNLGLRGCRLKTGTPPRLDGRTIDWSRFAEQPGDIDPTPFSFRTKRVAHHDSQVPCYIAWTTAETHRIIRENVHRSPMYSGQIQSIGPRYCPSIEDKIVKFPDKEMHQLFLEPEGLNTHEIYVNGMSTSLPVEVQLADSEVDPRPRERRDAAPRLRHRVRLDRSHGTGAHARNPQDCRPVSRRPDQRHLRLRRSRVPGTDGGNQRRAAGEAASRR